ncbi:unnamed protein product [Ambrosiozyma monospora]|uniref:Unnamed protein product n=1 Tax=Ambrosiozyma monospora TaxID=43982 RepID=A0ACB5STQ7_AMBMO|nr:unnamed protein product [Ambrosiozyma monospora]
MLFSPTTTTTLSLDSFKNLFSFSNKVPVVVKRGLNFRYSGYPHPVEFIPGRTIKDLEMRLTLTRDNISTDIDYSGLSNLKSVRIGRQFGINSLKNLPDCIERLELERFKNVQFPLIENYDQLVNLRYLKVLGFQSSAVSYYAKNLPVAIENLEFCVLTGASTGGMANLPALSHFNFKRVPNLYTLHLGVRPGKLCLSELPKSIHFLKVDIHYHSKYSLSVCLSQVPDMNLPKEKRDSKASVIISYPKFQIKLSLSLI